MHNHTPECNHKYPYGHPQDGESAIRYCSHCDMTYCELCKKEWGKKETVYIPNPYPIYPDWRHTPWEPYWTYGTAGSTANDKIRYTTTNSAGDIVHGGMPVSKDVSIFPCFHLRD